MTSHQCAVLCLALLPAAARPGTAQVVQVSAGAGNVQAASGALLGLHQPDSTTTLGVGTGAGVHVGFRREVSVGSSMLAVGDSVLDVQLPTDLESTPRTVTARGVLLAHEGGDRAVLFAGVTGATFANPFCNMVTGTAGLVLASTQKSFGPATLSLLHMSGTLQNTLVSAQYARRQSLRVAITAGNSGGHRIAQAALHYQTPAMQVDTLFAGGTLKLQPVQPGYFSPVERVGFNGVMVRRFGQRFVLTGGRHQYATADAGNNPAYVGVTAARSSLIETALQARAGPLRLQTRGLWAASGTARNTGLVSSVAFSRRLWNVQALYLRNWQSVRGATAVSPANQNSSLHLRAAEQLTARLRLEQDMGLGGGTRQLHVGGSWQGNRVALSVSNQQTFVPFGVHGGFHNVLTVGIRLRTGDAESSAAVAVSPGLPTTVLIGGSDYFGALAGETAAVSRTARMARYVAAGRVLDETGNAVAGAAVRLGDQTVYTDADGHFSARFTKSTAVTASVIPEAFVSAQEYRATGDAVLVTPAPAATTAAELSLRVAVLRRMPAALQLVAAKAAVAAAPLPVAVRHRSLLSQTGQIMLRLAARMVHWRATSAPPSVA